jgi:autotransporter-associated beta strand protein
MKNKFRFVNIRASRRLFIPSILATAVAFALASNQAQAQTRVWNGTVANLTNGAWGTAGNWLAADVPDTNLEIASLSKDWTGTAPTFALGADRTVNGVIYEDTGATGDFAGSIVAGSTLTLSGTTPTITTTNSLTISATLGWGAAGFTKNGAVTLILSGGNTGTGPVTLSAGIIRATNNANALGTGAATLSLTGAGTVLQLANDTGLNFARNTTLSAATTTITADRLTGAATSTTHTLGTLSIGANTLSITRGSGITGAGIGGITFGTVTQTGASVFDTGADTTLTLGALQTTAQNITKQGAGTLVLGTAANAARVAGSNILTAGTMRLGSANALGTTGATLALNGGILDLATDTTVNAYNTTVGGATTINSNKAAAASAGITHTLGTLSIGAQTLNVTRGSNATSGTGAVTFGATTMTGNATFSPAANAQLTLGAVGGAFTLTKSGAGLAVLSAAGSYTGATSVTAGTLRAGNATAFGTTAGGVSITSGAVVDLNGVAIGAEPFTLNGTGISSDGALINSSGTGASLSGTIALASNSSVGGNSGNLTLSGIISGSGTLTKVGTGKVILTGANTFANGVTVQAGTLELQTSAAAAGTGTILLGDTTGTAAATLQGGSSLTHTNPITVQAGSSGVKTISTYSAANTVYTGLVTLNAPLTVSNLGTGNSFAVGIQNSSSTSVNLNSHTLTISNTNTGRSFLDGVVTGTGSVVMNSSGAGEWVPRGDFTYSGGTTLTAGSVTIDRDTVGSAGAVTSGPFGTGTVTMSGAQLRAGTTQNRTVANNVVLSANTTFYTTGSEKTLNFSGLVTLSGASRVITANVGTTVLGAATIFSGPIGDGGNALGLTKAGTGNLTLGGANTYTGATTVNDGALILSGSLQTATALTISPTVAGGAVFSLASGTANPLGNVSALTIGSATGPSTIGLELGAATATSDSIITPNAATTAGTVNIGIMALAGFGTASTYDLISAPSGLSGASYALTNAPGGFTYSLTTTASLVQLGVTPTTAGDLYWRGNLSNSWSALSGANTNWYSNSAGTTNAQANPGAGNTVNFSTVNATNTVGVITTTLDNNFTVKNLVFGSDPNGVTAVTIAGGLTPALVPGVLAIAPSTSADGIAVGANAGSVTISAPVILGANQNWSADGTGLNGSTLTVSGAISGTNALTISGLVVLSAPALTSTYSGATTVDNAKRRDKFFQQCLCDDGQWHRHSSPQWFQ